MADSSSFFFFVAASLPSPSASARCGSSVARSCIASARVFSLKSRVPAPKARASPPSSTASRVSSLASAPIPGVIQETDPPGLGLPEVLGAEDGAEDEDEEDGDEDVGEEEEEEEEEEEDDDDAGMNAGRMASDEEAEVDREMEMFEGMEIFVPPGAKISEEKPLRRLPCSNICLGPYARDSRVKQAEFVKSSGGVDECPDTGLPEFAVIGRSNVGKSSLVNALVQRKSLAQTSKKPGIFSTYYVRRKMLFFFCSSMRSEILRAFVAELL
jgi:hypothetical protein